MYITIIIKIGPPSTWISLDLFMLGEVEYQFLGFDAFSEIELVVLPYFSQVGLISSLINLVERPPLWQVGPAILLPHHGLKKSHFNTLDFLFHPDNYTIIRLHSKKNPSRGNWCGREGGSYPDSTALPERGSRGTNADKSSRKRREWRNGGGRKPKHLFDFNLATLRAFKEPSSVCRLRLLPISCYQCWK